MKTVLEILTGIKNKIWEFFQEELKEETFSDEFSFPTPCSIINMCGCTSDIVIVGSEESREKKIRREAGKICFKCQTLFWNYSAIKNAKRKRYAELTGSPKQIAWALNIRDRVDLDLPPDHPIFVDITMEPYADSIQLLRARLVSITESRWWICNRDKLENKSLLDLTEQARVGSKKSKTVIKNINKIACKCAEQWAPNSFKLTSFRF